MTLKIELQKTGTELTVLMEGKLDTSTAPNLKSELEAQWADVTKLVLDFGAVTFLSSAGVRTILWSAKQMQERQGTLILRNVNDQLKEVFVLTGLDTVLNFE